MSYLENFNNFDPSNCKPAESMENFRGIPQTVEVREENGKKCLYLEMAEKEHWSRRGIIMRENLRLDGEMTVEAKVKPMGDLDGMIELWLLGDNGKQVCLKLRSGCYGSVKEVTACIGKDVKHSYSKKQFSFNKWYYLHIQLKKDETVMALLDVKRKVLWKYAFAIGSLFESFDIALGQEMGCPDPDKAPWHMKAYVGEIRTAEAVEALNGEFEVKKPDVEAVIKAAMSGDALTNALDYAAFLRANEFTPDFHGGHDNNGFFTMYSKENVSYLMISGREDDFCGPWTIWFNFNDFGDGDGVADELKETAWKHASNCGKCHPGWADCGCGKRTIFGKDFDHLCHSPLMFTNPDAKTLEHVKKLMLLLKPNIIEMQKKRAAEAAISLEKGKKALVEYESAITNKQPEDIDLTTMTESGSIDVKYIDGKMSIYNNTGDESANCGMVTPKWFNGPVKIELRAKTDSTNIRLYYCYGEMIINWECNLDELRIHDVATSKEFGYHDVGRVPCDEFVDIEWLIGRDVMAVKVNGELRHAGVHYPYIEKLKEPDNEIGSRVRVTSDFGSTVTVESLRVTEL